MEIDVKELTEEAKAVRDAMATMGWQYIGGGPYPCAPVLRFIRGNDLIKIAMEPVTP
jgi:hypothetical protein